MPFNTKKSNQKSGNTTSTLSANTKNTLNAHKKLENNTTLIRQLQSAFIQNKVCFDCGQKGPTYVNMTIGTFVCTKCSGILRGLNPPHRIKSISMSAFTNEEVDFLRRRGNEWASTCWLALCDPSKRIDINVEQNVDDDRIKQFMIDKYEKKRYYIAQDANSKDTNSVNGDKSPTAVSQKSIISLDSSAANTQQNKQAFFGGSNPSLNYSNSLGNNNNGTPSSTSTSLGLIGATLNARIQEMSLQNSSSGGGGGGVLDASAGSEKSTSDTISRRPHPHSSVSVSSNHGSLNGVSFISQQPLQTSPLTSQSKQQQSFFDELTSSVTISNPPPCNNTLNVNLLNSLFLGDEMVNNSAYATTPIAWQTTSSRSGKSETKDEWNNFGGVEEQNEENFANFAQFEKNADSAFGDTFVGPADNVKGTTPSDNLPWPSTSTTAGSTAVLKNHSVSSKSSVIGIDGDKKSEGDKYAALKNLDDIFKKSHSPVSSSFQVGATSTKTVSTEDCFSNSFISNQPFPNSSSFNDFPSQSQIFNGGKGQGHDDLSKLGEALFSKGNIIPTQQPMKEQKMNMDIAVNSSPWPLDDKTNDLFGKNVASSDTFFGTESSTFGNTSTFGNNSTFSAPFSSENSWPASTTASKTAKDESSFGDATSWKADFNSSQQIQTSQQKLRSNNPFKSDISKNVNEKTNSDDALNDLSFFGASDVTVNAISDPFNSNVDFFQKSAVSNVGNNSNNEMNWPATSSVNTNSFF